MPRANYLNWINARGRLIYLKPNSCLSVQFLNCMSSSNTYGKQMPEAPPRRSTLLQILSAHVQLSQLTKTTIHTSPNPLFTCVAQPFYKNNWKRLDSLVNIPLRDGHLCNLCSSTGNNGCIGCRKRNARLIWKNGKTAVMVISQKWPMLIISVISVYTNAACACDVAITFDGYRGLLDNCTYSSLPFLCER